MHQSKPTRTLPLTAPTSDTTDCPRLPTLLQVRAILRSGRIQELVAADELTCMRKAGRAFQGWQEGPLSFPPTFKFRRGTSHYIGKPLFPGHVQSKLEPRVSMTACRQWVTACLEVHGGIFATSGHRHTAYCTFPPPFCPYVHLTDTQPSSRHLVS